MTALPDAPPPYGTLVFDCDSTLSEIEGIEELAGAQKDEIAELTNRAMDGAVPLEEVYGLRLERIRPTRPAVDAVAELYFERRLQNSAELVAAARALGKRVVVVSGGVTPAVAPFAALLGIPAPADVFAVDLRFDEGGAYAGFEEDSPLARAGGKIDVLRRIAAAESAGPVAFVGDGATDLEAAAEVARFVAFGGVARRPAVFEAARVRCEAADFAALVPHLFSPDERARLGATPDHGPLIEAARTFDTA